MNIGSANTVSGTSNFAIGESNTVSATGGYANALGNNNTVTGLAAVAIGTINTASGTAGLAEGNGALDRGRFGALAWSTSYRNAPGDAQIAIQALRAQSTSTGATRLTADGTAAGAANVVNIPVNTAYMIKIDLDGKDATSAGNAASVYQITGLLDCGATLATCAYTAGAAGTVVNHGTGLAGAPTIAADTTNGGLSVSVTPPNSHTWNWVARVETVEVQ